MPNGDHTNLSFSSLYSSPKEGKYHSDWLEDRAHEPSSLPKPQDPLPLQTTGNEVPKSMVSNERTEKQLHQNQFLHSLDSTNWRKPISVIKGWFSPSMRPCTCTT
ncbi:hypothetical protein CIPAW_01G258700 [Carya illinoinensis]|uniref:Uncharacterized protein n=1 Tax=Carya illinoinensis TaxID=32201 RepID=A0A8T1RU88_CARIL|nr:hypothetical protein CIPAW_01G258700 [Carya illinoinensis]